MVHDLSFVSFPQGFHAHEQWVYANLVRACARAARHLLTVSQFSKQELMQHWKIPADKITVTYDGLDACYTPSGSEPTREDPPYILYVGNLHPRKNIVRLLDAYVQVCKSGKFPHRLKIVGQATWMAGDVFAAVRESEFADRVEFTGYLSYEKLTSLYQNAAVCVYPSLYEGFGLPVLEAMACGCPVVCSNTTSVPEVAGDACIQVNPESSSEIAQGICSILSDPSLAQDLRQRGPRQAASFTWEGCAEATLSAYRSAVYAAKT
jgi:glycosyltransferase involved in cell wall biosynthesis